MAHVWILRLSGISNNLLRREISNMRGMTNNAIQTEITKAKIIYL